MKKVLYPIVLAILLLAASVSAALEITHSGPKNIHTGTEVVYNVTVLNQGGKEAIFTVEPDPFASFPTSDFEYVLVEPSQLKIAPFGRSDFIVKLKLKKTVPVGRSYGTFVKLVPIEDPQNYVTHSIDIYAVNPEHIISVDIDVPEQAIPSKEFSFDVKLTNNINTQLSGVDLFVSSDLFDESRELFFYGLQDRSEHFSFAIPAATDPGSYPLSVRIYKDKKLLGKQVVKFGVEENPDVKEKEEITKSLLKKVYSVEKENKGNTQLSDSYDLSLSSFENLFVSFNIEPKSETEGVYYWEFNLNPGERIKITATVDYSPLFVIAVVLLLFIILGYYMLSRGVKVKKDVLKVKQTKEGTELKILLHIKNNTRRKIKNISIVEILPKILRPSARFGTLRPDKVQRGDKGVRLIWKLEELIPGEERIISYEVNIKMNIIGKLMLPPCLVRYKSAGNKVVHVRSKPLALIQGAD